MDGCKVQSRQDSFETTLGAPPLNPPPTSPPVEGAGGVAVADDSVGASLQPVPQPVLAQHGVPHATAPALFQVATQNATGRFNHVGIPSLKRPRGEAPNTSAAKMPKLVQQWQSPPYAFPNGASGASAIAPSRAPVGVPKAIPSPPANATRNELMEYYSALAQENGRLNEKSGALEKELGTCKQELGEIKQALDGATAQNLKLEAGVREAREREIAATDKVEEHVKANGRLEAERDTAIADRDAVKAVADAHAAEIAKLIEKVRALEQDAAASELRHANNLCDALTPIKAELEQAKSGLSQSEQQRNAEREELMSAHATELETLREKLSTSESTNATLKTSNEKLNERLNETVQAQESRVARLVHDSMKVARDQINALEARLTQSSEEATRLADALATALREQSAQVEEPAKASRPPCDCDRLNEKARHRYWCKASPKNREASRAAGPSCPKSKKTSLSAHEATSLFAVLRTLDEETARIHANSDTTEELEAVVYQSERALEMHANSVRLGNTVNVLDEDAVRELKGKLANAQHQLNSTVFKCFYDEVPEASDPFWTIGMAKKWHDDTEPRKFDGMRTTCKKDVFRAIWASAMEENFPGRPEPGQAGKRLLEDASTKRLKPFFDSMSDYSAKTIYNMYGACGREHAAAFDQLD